MKVSVLDTGKQVALSDSVFAYDANPAVIHQALVAQQASVRQGSKAQKTRAQVSGGGKKPWRQKGTGRARVGSSNNPVWRGGGVTFAANPQDHSKGYNKKLNKKMYKAALKGTLSALIKDNRMQLISDIKIKNPKTKELIKLISKYKLDHKKNKINILVDKTEDNLNLAARNLPEVQVISVSDISIYFLIRADKSLITLKACEELTKSLADDKQAKTKKSSAKTKEPSAHTKKPKKPVKETKAKASASKKAATTKEPSAQTKEPSAQTKEPSAQTKEPKKPVKETKAKASASKKAETKKPAASKAKSAKTKAPKSAAQEKSKEKTK